MSKDRCAATVDETGWRIELIRRQGRLFAKEEVLAVADWPTAAGSHPGVALLLSLLDAEDAQRDGEAVRLIHAAVAGLSRAETSRIGLPPIAPFTLFFRAGRGIRPVRSVTCRWSKAAKCAERGEYPVPL